MKTKQEQTKKMAEKMKRCFEKNGLLNFKWFAEALVQAGYGDVSEYKAEIGRLKAEVKQAQINVLNELKTRHDYAIKNMGYPWDITQQIDELIEEVENGEDKG